MLKPGVILPLLSLLLAPLRVLAERESDRTSLRNVPSSLGVVGGSALGMAIGEGARAGLPFESEGESGALMFWRFG